MTNILIRRDHRVEPFKLGRGKQVSIGKPAPPSFPSVNDLMLENASRAG